MAYAEGVGEVRGGGSPAYAMERFSHRHPAFFREGEPIRIIIEPDTTAEQSRRAYEAMWGRG